MSEATTATKPKAQLWLSDARGVYIPRDFAQSIVDRGKNVINVSEEEWERLEAGPDAAWYWETWDNVLNNAIVVDGETRYTLHQDGDLWLVPEGMRWDEEKGFIYGDEDQEDG